MADDTLWGCMDCNTVTVVRSYSPPEQDCSVCGASRWRKVDT